jgi:hypothetical protein
VDNHPLYSASACDKNATLRRAWSFHEESLSGTNANTIPVVSAMPSSAKDHSGDYKLGTLIKVPLHVGGKVSMGYTDTTSCTSGIFGIHCTGGIVDDYGANLVADMPDGNELVIEPCASGATMAALSSLYEAVCVDAYRGGWRCHIP